MDALRSDRASGERPGRKAFAPWLAPAAILVIVTLFVFGGTIRNGFVAWDDEANVMASPYMQPVSARTVLAEWREPYFAMYIPVTRTVWSAIGAVAEGPKDGSGHVTYKAGWFHAANVLAHLANVLLVFALLRRLVREDWAAMAGALLFAIHPVQVEPVSWVTGMKDLLGTLLTLGAAIQYLRAMEDGRGRYLAATVQYTLSLLAKPSAAALPLILLVIEGAFLRRPVGKSVRWLAPWAILAVPVMLVTRGLEAATGAVPQAPLWARPLIAGDTYAWYLRKLVWPGAASVDYGRSPDVVIHSMAVFAAWLLPLGVGVLAWRLRQRIPGALAGFGVFVAAILPVSGLTCFAFQAISDVADRYVYLAMLGPALALAAVLAQCRRLESRRTTIGIATACLIGLSVSAVSATRQWVDSESLLQHTLDVNPRSWMAWNNLAVIRERAGDIGDAKKCYAAAIRVNPSCFMAHNNLGMILEREGRVDDAAVHFGTAVRANPMYPEARFNHGRMLARGGDRLGAAKEFKRAIALDGGYVLAYNNLGAMLTLLGRPDDARACFRQAVELDGRCGDAQFNLGVSCLQAGRAAEAEPHLAAAVRLQPENVQAKRALADARVMLARQARR